MKKLTALLLALCLIFALAACGQRTEPTPTQEPQVSEEPVTIRVGGMTGPTSMGMVKLMSDSEAGATENSYEFSLETGATVFAPALTKGEIDIAAVPSNLASVIFNNTDGGVKAIAVNTLGVLYIVERGESVSELSDLAGKTVYATGQGATPEYTLRYLLKENGLDPDGDVTIVWCADTTEALANISADENAIAMLPQPFVTVAQSKVEGLRVALDLNGQWDALDNGSKLVTGVVVVRTEFAEKYPQQLQKFLEEYEASVAYTQSNPEDTAQLIADYEIVPAAPVALKALPQCNVTYLAGDEMKAALSGFIDVLFAENPQSVGGAVPGGEFYYGAAD